MKASLLIFLLLPFTLFAKDKAIALADIYYTDLWGFGECASELHLSQLLAAPSWKITDGAPPLLPKRAEDIALAHLYRSLKQDSKTSTWLFHRVKTSLVKYDEDHWYYAIIFFQGYRYQGGTGGRPHFEVFVTFDGKPAPIAVTKWLADERSASTKPAEPTEVVGSPDR